MSEGELISSGVLNFQKAPQRGESHAVMADIIYCSGICNGDVESRPFLGCPDADAEWNVGWPVGMLDSIFNEGLEKKAGYPGAASGIR